MYHFIPHKRKRPPTKIIRLLDKLILFLSFITPLSALPQIIEVFLKKDAGSVSVITWGLWWIISIPWLIYGIVHRIKPIIIVNSLWLLVHSMMIALIIIY
jgi:uncharacterized protein with PQ loop repeat